MTIWQEFRFWSPTLGCNAARISMTDRHGGEFFKIIPRDASAKAYREAREKALDEIEDAIAARQQPGEVHEDEQA